MRGLSVARLSGGLTLLFSSLALAASCAPPDFAFEGAPVPAHCSNQVPDASETDVDCGGGCPPCALGQTCLESGDCAEGDCIESFCQDVTCSDGMLGGEESDLDCGGSLCKPCPPGASCLAASDCDSSVCSEGVCSEPTCNDSTFNGDESDTDCGGSCPQCLPGRVCDSPDDCVGELCGVDNRCALTCLEGSADCDLDAETCETNLRTSPENCGECGLVCNLPHAEAGCSAGSCYVDSCVEPFVDCDGDDANGCEANTGADPENCGACGKKCPSTHGTPLCIDSKCAIECDPGYADCDENPINGCERGTDADAKNCGECGNVCPDDEGQPYCLDGQCGATPCPSGFGNCNGNLDDGCEADLRTDVDNCDSCGNFCSTENGTPACDDRLCIIDSCDDGFDDCDDEYVGGCEASLTSLEDCGECGVPCSIPNASATCSSGSCQVLDCTTPYEDCDGDDLDCEVNVATSTTNCGGCAADGGKNCNAIFAPLHTEGQCDDQVCEPGECFANYEDCDTSAANGCEANLQNDTETCGSCQISCAENHASSTSCGGGTCAPDCDEGWAACGKPEDGCTTSIDTAEHCGNCQTSCTGMTPFCVSRSCKARLSIELGNTVSSATAQVCNSNPCNGFTLQLSHTLEKPVGSHRAVVVAVATTGANQGAATPDQVSYGAATSSSPVVSQWTSNRAWVGIYVFQDAQLPSAAMAASTVSIAMGSVDSTARVAASVLEFSGVEQSTPPVLDSAAASKATCSPTSATVTTEYADSWVVSAASLFGETNGTATGMPAPTETLDVSASEFTALAGYAKVGSGDYTFGWTTGACNNNAHVLIALDPAKTP